LNRDLFARTLEHATAFLDSLAERRVGPNVSVQDLRAALDHPLPEGPVEAIEVIDHLARGCDPGLMGTAGPRFFGFVIGGSLPAAMAADWLTSAWDQNAGLYAASPAASVVEEVAGRWMIELLGLPTHSSFAFVTGAQMAHFVTLAAARHHLYAQQGWNVEKQGIMGGPRVRVVAGDQRHATIDRALRYLGFGTECLELVPTDEQGRIQVSELGSVLDTSSDPAIVCVQTGDVNTGAFDDVSAICDLVHARNGWVHVDGAIWLWAAASKRLRHLTEGIEKADSWTTDGHKTLNVPYDSGLAFCKHPDSHRAAMGVRASYLVHAESERDEVDWVPEFSRRARGFAVYAALASLGVSGVDDLVTRLHDLAVMFAEKLRTDPGVEVVNEISFNQVLVSFKNQAGADITPKVVELVQQDGTCWLSGSTWKGRPVMRISVSNWATSASDVEMSADAIIRIARSLA
jgi:glutamate/tyrosine decarboxylase-like PLP-dependent enzyme